MDTNNIQISSESGELRPEGNTPKYRKVLQWALAVFGVLWVIWYFYHNRSDLSLFAALSLPIIVLLLVLFVLHLWLYSLQFFWVIRKCADRPLPFTAFFKTIILGRFLSSIAPQAGNLWRAYYLKQKFGISYTRYLGGFFGFLWVDAAMNVLLSAIVFAIFAPTFCIGPFSIWLVLTLMAVTWFLPIVFEGLFRRGTFRLQSLVWLHDRLSEMLTVGVRILGDYGLLIRVVMLNTLNFANNIIIFYFCLSRSEEKITIPALAVYFILLKVTSYLIITPGNVGVREMAYGLLSQQMGIGAGQGIVVSIFYRIFGMIIVLLFGIFFGGLGLLKKPQASEPTQNN